MSRRTKIDQRPPLGWTRYCVFDSDDECDVYFIPPSSSQELRSLEEVEDYIKRNKTPLMLNPLLFDFGCHAAAYDGIVKQKGKLRGKKDSTFTKDGSKSKAASQKTVRATTGKMTTGKTNVATKGKAGKLDKVVRSASAKPKKKAVPVKPPLWSTPTPSRNKKPLKGPHPHLYFHQKSSHSSRAAKATRRAASTKRPVAAKTSQNKRSRSASVSAAKPAYKGRTTSKTKVSPTKKARTAGKAVTVLQKRVLRGTHLTSASPQVQAANMTATTASNDARLTKNKDGRGRPVARKRATVEEAKPNNKIAGVSKRRHQSPSDTADSGSRASRSVKMTSPSMSATRGASSSTPDRPTANPRVQKPRASGPKNDLSGTVKVIPLPPKKRGHGLAIGSAAHSTLHSANKSPGKEERVTLKDLLPVRETRQGFRSVARVEQPSKTKKAKQPVRVAAVAVAIEKPKPPPKPQARTTRSQKPTSPRKPLDPVAQSKRVVPPNVAEIRRPLLRGRTLKDREKKRASSSRQLPEQDSGLSSGDESIVLDKKLRKPASRALRVTSKSTKSKTVQKKTRMTRKDEIVARELLNQISAVLEGSRARRSSGPSGMHDLIKSQITERSFTMSGRAVKPANAPEVRADFPPRADTPETPQKAIITTRVVRRVAHPVTTKPTAAVAAPVPAARKRGRPATYKTLSSVPTPIPSRLTQRQVKMVENKASTSKLQKRKATSKLYRGQKAAALKRKAKVTLTKSKKAKAETKTTAYKKGRKEAAHGRKTSDQRRDVKKPTVKAKALPSPDRPKPNVSFAKAVRLARQLSAKRRVKTIPPQVRGNRPSFTPTPGAKIVMPGVALPPQVSSLEVDPALPSPSSSSTETDSDAAAMLMNGQGTIQAALNDFPFPYPASPLYRGSGDGALRKRTETENLETVTLEWNPQDMELYNSLSALSHGSNLSGDQMGASRRKSHRSTTRRVAAYVTQSPIANYVDPDRIVHLPETIANDHCYIKMPQRLVRMSGSLESMEFDHNSDTPVSADHSSVSAHDLLVSPYPSAQTVVVPSTLGTLTTAADLLASVENPESHEMSETGHQGDVPPSTSPFLFHQAPTGISTSSFPSGIVGGYVDTNPTQFVSNSGAVQSIVCGGYSSVADTGNQAGPTGSPPSNFLEMLAGAQATAFAASMDEMLASSSAGGRSRGASGDVNLPLITGVPASVLSAVLATPNITPASVASPGCAGILTSGTTTAQAAGKSSIIHDVQLQTSSYSANQYYDATATRHRADLVPDFLPENILEGDSTDMSVENE